jgi:putative transposase
VEIAVPRARLNNSHGMTTEWNSRALQAFRRRTLAADALIAGCYLAGTSTRRVRGALGAVCWCSRQGHGEPGVAEGEERLGRLKCHSLAEEPIVRLILDGTLIRVRRHRKGTAISLLVVIGVRSRWPEDPACGQGHGQREHRSLARRARRSHPAWLRRPEFLIVNGASGLENAIAAIWDGVPVQRSTIHKHRNLSAHALALPPDDPPLPAPAPLPGARTGDVLARRRQ